MIYDTAWQQRSAFQRASHLVHSLLEINSSRTEDPSILASCTHLSDCVAGNHLLTVCSNRGYSRETSGDSTPIAATPPIPPQLQQQPISAAQPPYASRPFMLNLSRGDTDPAPPRHPAQDSMISSMSHLAISALSTATDHISNPSPFTMQSPLAPMTYSNLATIPYVAGSQPLNDLRSTSGSGPSASEPRALGPGVSSASMAFDTAPAFIPAPQAWTRAPLQTTDDLVAYLEHRRSLTQP